MVAGKGWERGRQGAIADGHRVSVWGDKNSRTK